MSRKLIDRDALIASIPKTNVDIFENCRNCSTLCDWQVRELIEQAELVDAVEVKHGKWIKLDMHAHLADHKCTACGQECYVPTCMGEPMYTYCPNCGASMDGEKKR